MTTKVLKQLVGGEPPEAFEVNFMCPEEFATYREMLDIELEQTDLERREQESAVDKFLREEGLL